jgi:hypothetical protein
MALSLRGIARQYAGTTGAFSVEDRIFGGSISGRVSLRQRLETLARRSHSFRVSECIYGWTAAFDQTWSHIVVRIRLNPDSGISDATMNNLRTTWQTGIESTGGNRWAVGRNGEATLPFTFDVQWVGSNQHHSVRVRTGPARSNMTTWDTNDTGGVAAHEFGHMLGHQDEYADGNCPGRSPTNTGTVMDNNTDIVPMRLLQRFADNLGSNVVALP